MKDKVYIGVYKIKRVAQVWYTQWKNKRLVGAGQIDWELFKSAFLDRFFLQYFREVKVK